MSVRSEIFEQPEVARRLLTDRRDIVERIANVARQREIDVVVIAARGSSDHAAIYAQYVLGVRNEVPVALAAPSILSVYGARPRFRRALVVGISQSGASPDIVGVVAAAREQEALTVAITNDPGSALAAGAEHVLDLGAGPERAIAATKTYTAELVAVAMLSASLAGDQPAWADLAAIPDRLAEALAFESDVEPIARAQRAIAKVVILGRGFEYATAREWALKLKELTYVAADPYSAADFEHGPLALLHAGFPVFVLASGGPTVPDLTELLGRLAGTGADLLVLSDRPELRRLAARSLALPAGVAEWLTPITSAVIGQLHAYHLAVAKGLDPESPRNLRKVTETT